MAEYNSDPSMLVPGGLAGAPPPEMQRKITLLQRNAGMFKATLSSSAGWILRDNLCRLGVELIARYRCRHDRRYAGQTASLLSCDCGRPIFLFT